MEWNVFRYNNNKRMIEKYNIFNHGSFVREFDKLKRQQLARERFAKELDGILMYYFWCKYEYEVVVGEYSERENRKEIKVDIYEQIKMNWECFLEYVLSQNVVMWEE